MPAWALGLYRTASVLFPLKYTSPAGGYAGSTRWLQYVVGALLRAHLWVKVKLVNRFAIGDLGPNGRYKLEDSKERLGGVSGESLQSLLTTLQRLRAGSGAIDRSSPLREAYGLSSDFVGQAESPYGRVVQ